MVIPANELTNWNGTAISYDNNGNMLSDGTNAFSWNARNQVAVLNGVSLQYDAGGRRIKNAAGTSFLYDGANAAQELSGSTVTANLLGGGVDEIFSRADGSGGFTPLTDVLGSTIALVDSSGNVRTSYSYDPFGNTTASGAASGSPSQYTGRENDGNGIYYYRARYYSPCAGRFISEDPLGFDGSGPNLYAYALDNPTNLTDPSGLQAGGSGSGGKNPKLSGRYVKPWDFRDPIIFLPEGHNDCADFFKQGNRSAIDIISHVQITLVDVPDPKVGAQSADFPWTPIEVNPNGPFYDSSPYSVGHTPGGTPIYAPGSFGARMVILLHELAHKAGLPPGVFPEDALSPAQSEKNTGTIIDHCKNAIKAWGVVLNAQ